MRTFANEAARLAYVISADEAVQRAQFKQTEGSLDPAVPEIYIAVRQGAGGQAWERAYTDSSGGAGGLADGDYGDVIVEESGSTMLVTSATQEFALRGVETIVLVSGEVNNLAVSANVSRVRLVPSTETELTGITTGSNGRILQITNTGSADIMLMSNDSRSLSGNRLRLGRQINLTPDTSVTLAFDFSVDRWRPIADAQPTLMQYLTDADPIEFDPRLGLNAMFTITADRRLNFVAGTLRMGMRGTLRVVQDSVGDHVLTDISIGGVNGADIPGGSVADTTSLLFATAERSTILEWYWDGLRLSIWKTSTEEFYAYEGGA